MNKDPLFGNQALASDDPVLKLRELIILAKTGTFSIPEFCSAFERIYSFELDKKSVSGGEMERFTKVFNKVASFSPFPEEAKKTPHYIDETATQIFLQSI